MKIIYSFGLLFLLCHCQSKDNLHTRVPKKDSVEIAGTISNKLGELKAFLKQHKKYNTRIAFLVDMSVPSYQNRFFVCDLKKNRVIRKFLIAHGSGSNPDPSGNMCFSNTENSNCTSLGKYSIGSSYVGKFGKSYKLYGLDRTNDSAFVRNVVLHKLGCVPETEQEKPICNSLGCPMVSPASFKKIEQLVDHSREKIILYIYYGETD